MASHVMNYPITDGTWRLNIAQWAFERVSDGEMRAIEDMTKPDLRRFLPYVPEQHINETIEYISTTHPKPLVEFSSQILHSLYRTQSTYDVSGSLHPEPEWSFDSKRRVFRNRDAAGEYPVTSLTDTYLKAALISVDPETRSELIAVLAKDVSQQVADQAKAWFSAPDAVAADAKRPKNRLSSDAYMQKLLKNQLKGQSGAEAVKPEPTDDTIVSHPSAAGRSTSLMISLDAQEIRRLSQPNVSQRAKLNKTRMADTDDHPRDPPPASRVYWTSAMGYDSRPVTKATKVGDNIVHKPAPSRGDDQRRMPYYQSPTTPLADKIVPAFIGAAARPTWIPSSRDEVSGHLQSQQTRIPINIRMDDVLLGSAILSNMPDKDIDQLYPFDFHTDNLPFPDRACVGSPFRPRELAKDFPKGDKMVYDTRIAYFIIKKAGTPQSILYLGGDGFKASSISDAQYSEHHRYFIEIRRGNAGGGWDHLNSFSDEPAEVARQAMKQTPTGQKPLAKPAPKGHSLAPTTPESAWVSDLARLEQVLPHSARTDGLFDISPARRTDLSPFAVEALGTYQVQRPQERWVHAQQHLQDIPGRHATVLQFAQSREEDPDSFNKAAMSHAGVFDGALGALLGTHRLLVGDLDHLIRGLDTALNELGIGAAEWDRVLGPAWTARMPHLNTAADMVNKIRNQVVSFRDAHDTTTAHIQLALKGILLPGAIIGLTGTTADSMKEYQTAATQTKMFGLPTMHLDTHSNRRSWRTSVDTTSPGYVLRRVELDGFKAKPLNFRKRLIETVNDAELPAPKRSATGPDKTTVQSHRAGSHLHPIPIEIQLVTKASGPSTAVKTKTNMEPSASQIDERPRLPTRDALPVHSPTAAEASPSQERDLPRLPTREVPVIRSPTASDHVPDEDESNNIIFHANWSDGDPGRAPGTDEVDPADSISAVAALPGAALVPRYRYKGRDRVDDLHAACSTFRLPSTGTKSALKTRISTFLRTNKLVVTRFENWDTYVERSWEAAPEDLGGAA